MPNGLILISLEHFICVSYLYLSVLFPRKYLLLQIKTENIKPQVDLSVNTLLLQFAYHIANQECTTYSGYSLTSVVRFTYMFIFLEVYIYF